MMEYCATIKATQFLKLHFEANSAEEAEAKAAYYSAQTKLYQMPEHGVKWDYRLENEDGKVLADWDS